ncbi:MAG TPA: hypothetical protein VGE93_22300 [Bryobacteraceae bacterium]
MTIASDLVRRHIQMLVDDNAQWQTLIADDILWELAYAPSLGHPAKLSGREEAIRHATWFVGAVETFRFFNLEVYTLGDPQIAVAEVKGKGSLSLLAVCIARIMWCSCVLRTARSGFCGSISIRFALAGAGHADSRTRVLTTREPEPSLT